MNKYIRWIHTHQPSHLCSKRNYLRFAWRDFWCLPLDGNSKVAAEPSHMLIFLRFWLRGIFASSSDSPVCLHSQPVHHRQKVNHWNCLFWLGLAGRSRRDAICTQPKTKVSLRLKLMAKFCWKLIGSVMIIYYKGATKMFSLWPNQLVNILSKKKTQQKT